jgi:NodT family efflux transporter outer membrane factor (OMF) lipoprotein
MTAAEVATDATAASTGDANVATNDAATAAAEPINLDHWWSRFNDPVLDQLILKADMCNTSVAVALSNVRLAQANLGVTESELWPNVLAGAGYKRVQQNFSQIAATGIDLAPYDAYSYGLSLPAWEIDLWGRIARSIESSTADMRASVDDLRSAMTSIRAQVATAYVGLRTLQARLDVLDASIANLQSNVDLSAQKYASGTVTALDFNQAQSNLDLQSAEIPQLRSSMASTIGQLATLCGTTSKEMTSLLGEQRAVPMGPDSIPVGVPASLLERRADLRAANENYAAAVATIGAAEAQNYPALTLTGEFSISATSLSGLGDWSNKAYSFGPSLSLPLFTGWRISSQINAAKANTELKFNVWRGVLIRAIGEVETSIAALAFARDSDRRLTKAVASSTDTYRLAKLQYDAGTTQLENLIDAQNNMLAAEDSQVQARGLVAQSIVELYKSLGGGWEQAVPVMSNANNEAKDAIKSSPATANAESPIAREESGASR